MKILKLVLLLSCIYVLTFSSAFAASNLEDGVKELAEEISKNISSSNNKKIAVVEFSNLNDVVTQFGQFLSEELITNLFMVGNNQIEVVERRQLIKVLKEQDLGTSGLLDAKAMEKVGKILGVDAIVTGSISDLGNNIKINARLISVKTAKIFAVASTSIPKVGTVANLMNKEILSGIIDKSKQESSSMGNAFSSKNIDSKSKVNQTISADGIKFDLKKCIRKKSKLECDFDVQALDKDNFITLYVNHRGIISRVYDSEGGESIAKQIHLSGKNSTAYVQRLLIANIPTKAKLIFDDISTVASQISLLRFHYHSKNTNKLGDADFRNVAFAK